MGPVRELLAKRGADRLVFRAQPSARAVEILAAFSRDGNARADAGEPVSAEGPRERVPDALAALAAAGVRVFGVEKQSSTLEELFLEVTGGETV
jgi:hypothetical protein